MEPHLRIQPGQQALSPAQRAEARRFAQERIAAQFSTEPVDEPETERLVQQAYAVAGLPPPQRMVWLDGPLQLVAVLKPESLRDSVEFPVVRDMEYYVGFMGVGASVPASVFYSVADSVRASMAILRDNLMASVADSVRASMEASEWSSLMASVGASSMTASVQAYQEAPELALYRFLDEYLAPNALHALAHFNERVSGYWLGREVAFLVCRPTLLAHDPQGRLHSPSGKCLAYPDGRGFSAWHGVLVPEQVIFAPETLTREDFLSAPNVEVRRVIQERMGDRFVPELGGVVLDEGPRGTRLRGALAR
jgi:hypothetical protein